MGTIRFTHGTMASGKSALALQLHHTLTTARRNVELWTFGDRSGTSLVTSRLGISSPARSVGKDEPVAPYLSKDLQDLVIDEAQFVSAAQFEALAAWCDDTGSTIHAFGLTTDFTTALFEGSARFLALSDEIVALPVAARCWCGATGRVNARVIDGEVVRSGPTVLIGDVDSGAVETVHYEVLCRAHWRHGITSRVRQPAN